MILSRAAGRTGLAALALLLGGCATLAERDPASAPAGAQPAYRLEIDAPPALAVLLRTHLDLARFQTAPEAERITPAELDRLAAAAPAQARALLETEGHFAPTVTVQRAPDADADRPVLPLLRVRVDPGAVARVASFTLEVAGAAQEPGADRGGARGDVAAALRSAWPLPPGAPFRQAAWDDAKNKTLAALRAQGYPTASWRETEARVDVATASVRLRAVADSGPLFRLGALRIEGLARYDAKAVQRLAAFGPGAPATERTLLDFQERLQKVGLFESASVELDTDPALAAAAPVVVRVREQPLQQATLGVGVSANTGPRVTAEHLHRKPFGIPWVAKNQLELGGERRAWQADLISHPVPGLYRNLASASLEWLRSGEELRRSGSARLGRTQDRERIERLYYAEYTQERLTNPVGTRRSEALAATYQWVFRDLDNVLLPTDGQALSAQVAAGYARSSSLDNGPFGRLQARFTLWRPIGAAWYATARVEAGQVIADGSTGVPDSLLFRAGGDESVRGYAYRSLGPIRDGALASGRALLTGSVEVARPLARQLPSLWGALFVDAGNAADTFSTLHPAIGYGFGLRWRSPVGPLRIDLARGQDVHRWRLHLSVGIAF
jgi:translocation and assembly module TamA